MSWETYPLTRENLLALVRGKSREWLLGLFRERTTPKTLETIQHWTQEAGMQEITDAITTVRKERTHAYTLFFTYRKETRNQAMIVRFVNSEQQTRFHADYQLASGETGALLNLYLAADGQWLTDSDIGNPLVIAPIGEQIESKEKLQRVIRQAEVLTPEVMELPRPEGTP